MIVTRKPWIGGNWKCNGTLASNSALCQALNSCMFSSDDVDVVICPTTLHINTVQSLLDSSRYSVCAQNVSQTGNGAYTGEISVEMLKNCNITWTLIGHSERRQFYNETNSVVAAKVEICQKADINTVICIGELLEERKNGEMYNVLKRQMDAIIPKITNWEKVVVAYEPVWAIGTNVSATPQQAQEAHEIIRRMIKEQVNEATAASVRIVYGGSVNKGNCSALIQMKDNDGFLIGGASLKPDFCDIIKCVIEERKKV